MGATANLVPACASKYHRTPEIGVRGSNRPMVAGAPESLGRGPAFRAKAGRGRLSRSWAGAIAMARTLFRPPGLEHAHLERADVPILACEPAHLGRGFLSRLTAAGSGRESIQDAPRRPH